MDAPLKIIYQDDHYVAIDKPADLLVHRSALAARETEFALQILRDQIGRTVYPCHRLDRPTSGVLLFALDQDSLRFAQKEFANQDCDKIYRAVVRGWVDDAGEINYDLRGEEPPHKIKSAKTRFKALAKSELPYPVGRYETARFTLLELVPKTGRKHQLRRHMAHIRHPILGDTRHGDGAQNKFLRRHCGLQRMLLRADRLNFTHHACGNRVLLKAGPEDEFDRIVEQLGLA